MHVKKQQLELDMEQQTDSKSGKEYIKDVAETGSIRQRFWFRFRLQIWKGVRQGCLLYSCLFNLYAEYIMRNARLDEAQAEIKIAGRSINNLRYTGDIPLYGRK